ncbi:MAG: S8 family serine peptidase [Acidobacteriota bacterium]|nr:S8 family serine peptidase [Acidobacteriota bacterium]
MKKSDLAARCAWLLAGWLLLVLPAGADDRVTDQLLVELTAGASADRVAARHGLIIEDGIGLWRLWLMVAAEGTDIDRLVGEMNADPDVVEAEPHRSLENPEGVLRTIGDLDRSAGIDQFRGQASARTVRAAQAHGMGQGAGTIVAVLDTGMSYHHDATAGRIMTTRARNEVDGNTDARPQPNGVDDDGDGSVDEMLHHGTLVAGMVNLAAPAARILPIRVLDAEGRGTAFGVARGILYALQHGADVINLSLGMIDESNVIEHALEEAWKAGVVVVAAAGNRNLDEVDFPASDSHTIAVASVDERKIRSAFSSYGSDVDLTAPGVRVLSTYGEVDYGRWDGSSFAAPLVAGAAALVVERYPGLSPDEVLDLLEATAQPDANGSQWKGLLGAGTLDLEAVVAARTDDRTSLKVFERNLGTEVRWTAVLDAANYDLARGEVAALSTVDESTVDLGPLACLADDTPATDNADSPDAAAPAPGTAFFYVFRDAGTARDGAAWGVDSAGRDRLAGAGDCRLPSGSGS